VHLLSLLLVVASLSPTSALLNRAPAQLNHATVTAHDGPEDPGYGVRIADGPEDPGYGVRIADGPEDPGYVCV
jgi:hypothetical protein